MMELLKDFKRRFPIKSFSLKGVDVGKHFVQLRLSNEVQCFPFLIEITEEFMVTLTAAFLIRRIWITVKCPKEEFSGLFVRFDGRKKLELRTVVR